MMQKTITLYKAQGRIIVNDADKDVFLKSGYKKTPPKVKDDKSAKEPATASEPPKNVAVGKTDKDVKAEKAEKPEKEV